MNIQLGTPERPLSRLGEVAYNNYWTYKLVEELSKASDNISLDELCEATGIIKDDIINTLEQTQILQYIKGEYTIMAPKEIFEEYLEKTGPIKHKVI